MLRNNKDPSLELWNTRMIWRQITDILPLTWASGYLRELTLHHHFSGEVPELCVWVQAVKRSVKKPNLHVSLFGQQWHKSPQGDTADY